MDYHITNELQQHLDHGERLIWTGQPRKGIIFRPSDMFLIPFSMTWCGFSIFWVIMAAKGSIFFAMFGIPFVLIGLVLVFGRFIIDAKQRQYTYYGITNNRIIIKSGVYKKSIKSLDIKSLSDIEYIEKGDGSGTINLGPKNPMMMWGNGMNWWPGVLEIPSFDLIEDVRKVYSKIIEIKKNT